MKFAYCRVSTLDQNLNSQIDALKAAGCERFFEEKASGRKEDREQLNLLLSQLRPGDQVCVYNLSRLSRSLKCLIKIADEINAAGADLVSLNDGIDTSTPVGRFTFHIFGALNDYFIDNLRANTRAGLQSARARGRVGGRPKKLDGNKVQIAQALRDNPNLSVAEICAQLGVSRATFYRVTKGDGHG
jgi:DNA invertase Pin-like site-specific DNA recombinase